MEAPGIVYRRAELGDLFPLLKLYQVARNTVPLEPLLLDKDRLAEALLSPKWLWIVAARGGELCAAVSILLDRENRLARVRRFLSDPAWESAERMLGEALPLLEKYLLEKEIEVLYAATRTLNFRQQAMTLKLGFKMLGVFPEARVEDPGKLTGLTAYFLGDVLRRRRFTDFELHPVVAPFYEIAREECGLGPLGVLDDVSRLDPGGPFDELPTLEMIHAPRFVCHRFERLVEKRSLSVHFYPFHEPDAVVTDPEQKIEIFLRLIPENRFAAVIGERLDAAVRPAELYTRLSLMLRDRGLTYVEIINDAADPWGIECITRAGFVPCGYFPAFKAHGSCRRDYVVFARAFEKLFAAPSERMRVSRAYLGYLTEYYKVEAKNYLDRIQVDGPAP